MAPIDRRLFLKMIAAGALGGLDARAQSGPALPMGERFVHLNFSNGGLGWLFTALCPPSYETATNRAQLATWNATTPLDPVVTARGARFVIPRPLLTAIDAAGDRAPFERVLDGLVVFFGCGTGSPIHQTYAPSFQLALDTRASDISSEVARYQRFATPYPMINMAGTNLFGTGARSFLSVAGNDLSRLFEPVTNDASFTPANVASLRGLLDALNPDDHPGPYARTLGTQRVAAREAGALLSAPSATLTQLTVDTTYRRMNGVPLPLAMQPLALRLARHDIVDVRTDGGVNTAFVGTLNIGTMGATTLSYARGAAGILQAMTNGVGCENVQMNGIQDDPHNKIQELHAVTDQAGLHDAMLVKLQWVFGFLIELEKAGLFANTTVLIDGDFSRVLDAQYDDGGVNALIVCSGAKRLRPGYYGDSGVSGSCWFKVPNLQASSGASSIVLGPMQTGGSSALPTKLGLGIVLMSMGLTAAQAGAAAGLRMDEVPLLGAFAA